MRTCTSCGISKNPSLFYKRKSDGDALHTACKECLKAKARANRNAKLDIYRAYDRDRNKSPERKEQTERKTERKNVKWRVEQRHKCKAHRLMWRAIKLGELVKQPCERCGSLDVEGHHEDYSKPLEIKWLCIEHHNERHREINEERRSANRSQP